MMDRKDALGMVLRCLCDTAGPRTDQWCEEFEWTIEELDEAIKLLEKEAGLCGMGLL
jgi:hypothetical protein